MNGIQQDIRFSIRVLVRSPGATVVSVLALALGIGANTVTFSSVRSLVLYPLPFHDLDRIVRVWDTDPEHGFTQNMISDGDFLDWRERSRSFEYLAAFNVASDNLTGAGEPERIEGAVVSPDLFPLLGMKPLLGRTFDRTAEEPGHGRVVVLSHGLWQRRFGSDPGIIGRTISMDETPFTVMGVMPREFDFPIGAEFWASLTFTPRSVAQRSGRTLFVAGRLREGVSVEQASAEMNAITHELGLNHREDQGHGVLIRRVGEVTNTVTSRFVVVGFAAAAFVLLLGCVNVTNLQLARATARVRESAIRAALGATRWRIALGAVVNEVRGLIVTQAMRPVLAGIGLGTVAALALTRIMSNALYGVVALEPATFAGVLLLLAASAFIAGYIPARRASAVDPVVALREE